MANVTAFRIEHTDVRHDNPIVTAHSITCCANHGAPSWAVLVIATESHFILFAQIGHFTIFFTETTAGHITKLRRGQTIQRRSILIIRQ